MCGIAGYTRCGAADDDGVIGRMLQALHHRGPDDSGSYSDDGIVLGNALLAIVDIGNGHQPMSCQWDGETYVGVFNGEIYNHREIRKSIEALGLTFRTDCDTEVAIAAYAVWGADAVQRFEGQWALAVWEVRSGALFLCRDPFGIKPIFYVHKGDLFAFASEPKALLRHPLISAAPDLAAIQEYFLHGFAFAAGYSLNHRSFFDGIPSLEPGCWLRWKKKDPLVLRRYFQVATAAAPEIRSIKQAVEQLRDAVSSSVTASMMGDAPIGVALSGGLDSSIIASLAAREARRRGNGPLLATCITYDGQIANDDAHHAGTLADSLQDSAPLRLTYSHMASERYLSDLDLMISHFDEPHWEVKQLAMFNNYRVLKQDGAKVVLTGEGADELFFGYYHRFPGFRNPVIHSAAELETLWGTRVPNIEALFRAKCGQSLRGLMGEAVDRFYRPYADSGADPDRCMEYWYLATFLHWLLIDNDRCSMAFSLEGRFPFLNRRVFEVALAIPAAMQVGSEYGQEKMVLREAFRDMLPQAIWRDRKKSPLPSPMKLVFHRKIAAALRVSINDVPASIWDVLNRHQVEQIVVEFDAAVACLENGGESETGGNSLTRYLALSEPWSVRTTHVFGILTLLRWWKLNFS